MISAVVGHVVMSRVRSTTPVQAVPDPWPLLHKRGEPACSVGLRLVIHGRSGGLVFLQ